MRCSLSCALFSLTLVTSCAGDSISIERNGAAIASYCIDRATTAAERAMGLRGRTELCAECGLLIEFPRATEACIENDGVGFAIDVVYFNDLGRVTAVERNVAADDATSRCVLDVLSVLEVGGGEAAEIAVGDEIVH